MNKGIGLDYWQIFNVISSFFPVFLMKSMEIFNSLIEAGPLMAQTNQDESLGFI
jgi:hypothetical protein